MNLKVVAVGKRMPAWVDSAVAEYARRFSQGIQLQVLEVNTARRTRADAPGVSTAEEGRALLSHVSDNDWVVALEVSGKSRSTEQLAQWLDERIIDARNVVLVIGGPDGLSDDILARADECWSLSALTLPHGLARVIVVEALYRAHSLRLGHPYHRA